MKDILGVGKLSKSSLEVAKIVYPDLAQPAVKKVGIALETVFDLANTILLPLKLANETSKLHFQKHMEKYKEKIDSVDDSNIGKVPPEIGLPILDELLKVTNDELADLFINLLLNSSKLDKSQYAHPNFINVIKSLSADEAKIISCLDSQVVIFISHNRVDEDGMSVPLTGRYSNLDSLVNLDYEESAQFYIQNLIGLGIIREQRNVYFENDVNDYLELEKKYGYVKENHEMMIQSLDKGDFISKSTIEVFRGRNPLTEFGKVFLKAVKP